MHGELQSKNFWFTGMIFSTGKGDIILLLTYQCHPKGLIILLSHPKSLCRSKDGSNKIHINDVALDSRVTSLIGSYLQNNQSEIQPSRETKEEGAWYRG